MKDYPENSISKQRRSPAQSFWIGSCAATIDVTLMHPTVTFKVWCQAGQLSNLNKVLFGLQPNHSWVGNMRYKLSSVYRGYAAHAGSVIGNTTIRMLTYDGLISRIFNVNKTPTLWQQLVSTCVGGTLSSVFTTPGELIATWQQTANLTKKGPSFVQTASSIIKTHGLKRILTGLTCVSMRDSTVTSSILIFVPLFQKLLEKEAGMNSNMSSLIAGSLIGIFCAMLTHPLDTIKTKQHLKLKVQQPKELKVEPKSHNYWQFWHGSKHSALTSIPSIAREIYNNQGMGGFYSGMWWRVARVAPHISIVSYVVQQLTSMYVPSSGDEGYGPGCNPPTFQ